MHHAEVAASRALANQWHVQPPKARRGSRLVLVPWVLAVAALVALVLYSTLGPTPTRRAVAATAGGLVWGNAIIYNKHQMRVWLRWHGASYHTWQRRHPAALRIITAKHHHARTHRAARRAHRR